MSNYLIIGATSLIAQKYCELIAKSGGKLYLIARDEKKLKTVRDHLNALFPDSIIGWNCLDLNGQNDNEDIWIQIFKKYVIDVTLISVGVLGNSSEAQVNHKAANEIMNTNYVSIASLLTKLTSLYEKQRLGAIGVITSVAGERGRLSNYVYGSSKAGLSTFLSGYRLRMLKSNVFVTDLKLGPVVTPMTAHMKKNLLWRRPSTVARLIDVAIKSKRPVCYVPCYWRYFSLVLRLLPDFIFKRLTV